MTRSALSLSFGRQLDQTTGKQEPSSTQGQPVPASIACFRAGRGRLHDGRRKSRRRRAKCWHRQRSPMGTPFDLLDEFRDVVVAEARAQAQGSRPDYERPGRLQLRSRSQALAQKMVYHLLERLARAAGFRSELCGHILIESQCCSHVLMLYREHRDVNAPTFRRPRRLRPSLAADKG